MRFSKKMISASVAAVFLAFCSTTTFAEERSLYERLGGVGAIQAVVTKFISNVGGDARINGYFKNADLKQLNKHLVNQVCQATGGPCTYEGRDMKTAHKGMKVTTAAFNALVEDLVAALDTFNVPEKEKGELLAILGPMKADIVEVP
ncbi:MAG: group 1 truncated hemoglobin [Nitrospira sp.]|nr:group 1 truncated hemoglobin [Nitrospira sp.]MCP9442213.1 group 1 truncated hemoglobin [Nitrospira sp.]